jgi:hypothetical protein
MDKITLIKTETSSIWKVSDFTDDYYDVLHESIIPLLEHEPRLKYMVKKRDNAEISGSFQILQLDTNILARL